jgi:hypothetical protein
MREFGTAGATAIRVIGARAAICAAILIMWLPPTASAVCTPAQSKVYVNDFSASCLPSMAGTVSFNGALQTDEFSGSLTSEWQPWIKAPTITHRDFRITFRDEKMRSTWTAQWTLPDVSPHVCPRYTLHGAATVSPTDHDYITLFPASVSILWQDEEHSDLPWREGGWHSTGMSPQFPVAGTIPDCNGRPAQPVEDELAPGHWFTCPHPPVGDAPPDAVWKGTRQQLDPNLDASRQVVFDFDCTFTVDAPFHGHFATAGQLAYKQPPCQRKRTGAGYADLTDTMRSRLDDLYTRIEAWQGCYRFVIGYRSTDHQQAMIYDPWHAIADVHGPNDHRGAQQINEQLRAAGFAQMFQGRDANGVARGGPAKPGRSRHEKGEAADMLVYWQPFGLQTALDKAFQRKMNPRLCHLSHAVQLCGPPTSDLVHVELPYTKAGESAASCHFDC